MTKILAPLSGEMSCHPVTRHDEYLVQGSATHEVRVHVGAQSACTMRLAYHAHEKEAKLQVRVFVMLEKDATFSLDISSFLLAECSTSDVRVFLVLNEGSRATVRQLTHAAHAQSVVHEEIRGLAIGDYAHASFIPELALLHDDIAATHATSIVRVDEKRIAYFLARGVLREDAIECIVGGFMKMDEKDPDVKIQKSNKFQNPMIKGSNSEVKRV